MNAVERLNPRRHLAAAIGWSVLVIVALASLGAANLAARAAEDAAAADTRRLLVQFATQIRYALGAQLQNRLSIVQATAAQLVVPQDGSGGVILRHVQAVQAQFDEFAWLGAADANGRVVAATNGVFQGQSVADRPWYLGGRSGPYLGDVYRAIVTETPQPERPGAPPSRFVAVAAPIRDGAARISGVLGGHLSWRWIEQMQTELMAALDSRRQLDLLIADSDGMVMLGPTAWLGRTLTPASDATEGGRYAIGRAAARLSGDAGLSWTVIVRQPASAALAPARTVRTVVFLVVLAAGLAAAVAVVLQTGLLTRRLALLAEHAQAVRRGQRQSIAAPEGADEVSRIGAALAELVDHLQQEKAALASLNAELDRRVADRTARIERMADEARHAAVTRERLRLARDLHDTLAHSLMALLTQIRMIQKTKHRMAPADLGAELASAEAVAASGLADARAAITQMRHNGVREAGLAAALGDLVLRFSERTGVPAELHAAGPMADMAGERAEVMFRIVEEALTNVERHAQATAVTVSITSQAGASGPQPPGADTGSSPGDTVEVRVADDGVGFDTQHSSPGHYGLLGIREQAALIGARLELRSAPGAGTRLRLAFTA